MNINIKNETIFNMMVYFFFAKGVFELGMSVKGQITDYYSRVEIEKTIHTTETTEIEATETEIEVTETTEIEATETTEIEATETTEIEATETETEIETITINTIEEAETIEETEYNLNSVLDTYVYIPYSFNENKEHYTLVENVVENGVVENVVVENVVVENVVENGVVENVVEENVVYGLLWNSTLKMNLLYDKDGLIDDINLKFSDFRKEPEINDINLKFSDFRKEPEKILDSDEDFPPIDNFYQPKNFIRLEIIDNKMIDLRSIDKDRILTEKKSICGPWYQSSKAGTIEIDLDHKLDPFKSYNYDNLEPIQAYLNDPSLIIDNNPILIVVSNVDKFDLTDKNNKLNDIFEIYKTLSIEELKQKTEREQNERAEFVKKQKQNEIEESKKTLTIPNNLHNIMGTTYRKSSLSDFKPKKEVVSSSDYLVIKKIKKQGLCSSSVGCRVLG